MELLGENWVEAACGERLAMPGARIQRLGTIDIARLRQVTEDVLCCIVTRGLGLAMASLGLDYEIRVEGTTIQVELCMATAAWSLGEQIAIDLEQAICAALGVDEVEVQFVWTAQRRTVRMLPICNGSGVRLNA